MKRAISFILVFVMLLAVIPAGNVKTEAKGKGVITKENPAVIIRTSFATGEYDEGWGGVFQAVLLKETECAVLYDVVVWEDRINLYKFPNDVEDNEEEGYFGSSPSTKEGQKAYIKWREGFCLKSVKYNKNDDFSKFSALAKDAFIEFFEIVNKRTPSENIILKYSGHGSLGFCKCLTVEDTKALMKKGVSIFGQKFALIDFGTNCQSSTTNYFQVYHSYTDYMLTSQLDAGGYNLDKWDSDAYNKYDDDLNYTRIFSESATVEQAARSIVDIKADFWKLAKKNMKKGKIKQSMTLTDMSAYRDLWEGFYKVRLKVRSEGHGKDMYSLIEKYGDKKLKKLYKDFVIYYKDNNNSTFFKWDEKAYGITVYDTTIVEISKTSFEYNGKAQKPKIAVKDYTGTLQEGVDYTVKYSKGRKNVGKYKVTVTPKGTYGGEEVFWFTIKPKKTSISSLSAINDGLKIKWKTKDSQVSGYQIQYSTKSSFSSAKTVTVKGKSKASKTIKKLKSKKKYYVRVRTYKTVDGKKIYSAWSAKKSVKTK